MAFTRYNGLRKAGRTRRTRKRTSVATKAKWQKPTARNQRAQILGNARMISRVKSMLPPPAFCDWQQEAIVYAPLDSTGAGLPVTAWKPVALTDFAKWTPVLRISDVVQRAVSTKVLRLNLNMRYSLIGTNWAQISVFIVTPRRFWGDFDPFTLPLQSGEDFIVGESSLPIGTSYTNPRLNPARYKCHYVRHLTMSKGAWLQDPAVIQNQTYAGQPSSTFKKGSVNLKLNMKVRAPAITKWQQIPFDQLAYYNRYYLLVWFSTQTPDTVADGEQCQVSYDMLATTYNTA